MTLLTIHRAKGLEFDAVFLLALEEGLLPISYAKTDEEVEDERRLLYVGVTRARTHLHLSWARRRLGFRGKPSARRPSRLIYNLGEGAPTSTGTAPPTAGKPTRGGKPAPAPPLDVDPELAEALRTWRKERAKRDAVPAFVVCNDRTLTEIAARRPRSPEDLLGVHGFGPAKLDRYGEEVLAMIRARDQD